VKKGINCRIDFLTALAADDRQGFPVCSSCENLVQSGKREIDLLEIYF